MGNFVYVRVLAIATGPEGTMHVLYGEWLLVSSQVLPPRCTVHISAVADAHGRQAAMR